MQLDLSSFEAVRRFVAEFASKKKDLPPLYSLVLNAGLQFTKHTLSKDGFEQTFAVNHLGHFLLAHLMLSHFPKDRAGRIVFVASGVHDPLQKTGIPDPIYKTAKELANAKPAEGEDVGTFGQRAYSNSKLCNVLCGYEFARKLAQYQPNLKISVTSMDPGLMPGTGLARDYSGGMQFAWNWILPLARPFLPNTHTAAVSGTALAKLAVDPAFEGVTKKYFQGAKEINSSKDSYDTDKAADLWRTSVELTKLTAADVIVPEFLV